MEQDLNRIKLVLVEKKKTGKWLAQELGVSECTVSRWASNKALRNLCSLNAIAKLLKVDVSELLNLFVKPNEQSETCFNFAMARKGARK